MPIARKTTEIASSFGDHDNSRSSHNCDLFRLQQPPASCAGCAIAMLIIRFRARQVAAARGSAAIMGRKFESQSNNYDERTANRPCRFVSGKDNRTGLRKLNSRARIVPGVGGKGEVL